MGEFISWVISAIIGLVARSLELTATFYFWMANLGPFGFVLMSALLIGLIYIGFKTHSKYVKRRNNKQDR